MPQERKDRASAASWRRYATRAADDKRVRFDLSTSLRAQAKQSSLAETSKLDCFVASAPRNDAVRALIRISNSKYASAFSRRDSPEGCVKFAPLERRGRREDRVRAAPAVSCANEWKQTAHEHTGSAEASSLPCAMALRLIPRSPRRIGLCCLRRQRKLVFANLTPAIEASGPHGFAVRDRRRSSCAAIASTASQPAFRDDRDTPLLPGGTGRALH
jgi:hypothetical protein